ncbi:MAG: phage minor capsid protein [Deltaproteobacteria bacterium]|jgi:hypothetical protein|nr:phage minor capsid protein [Deltaproteobacteria bacterium]
MSFAPLRVLAGRKTPDGGFEETVAAMFDAEVGFVREAARLLGETGILALLLSDPAEAERRLFEAFAAVWRSRWDAGARGAFRRQVAGYLAEALRPGERVLEAARAAGRAAVAVPLAESPSLALYARESLLYLEPRIERAGLTAATEAADRILRSGALRAALGEDGDTLASAAREAVDALAREGVSGHRYPATGASISLEPYVRREIITTINRSANEAQIARAREWGSELIIVSAHAGARPLCEPWQGKVLSVSGSWEGRYPALRDTSYGRPAGLFGINCRHYAMPWFDGLNVEYPWEGREDPARLLRGPDGEPISNREVYEATQGQRAMEREIRDAKKRAARCGAAGDAAGRARAEAGVARWQARIRGYIRSGQARGIDLRRDYGRERVAA